jgi:8-oxo-dGTP pyrophosphatase MutT (NUDIX family)
MNESEQLYHSHNPLQTLLERWSTHERTTEGDYKIFTLDKVRRTATKRDGRTAEGTFALLNSPDWVNIIPLTPAHAVVMVKQYRHGIDDFTLEVPGGLVDRGEDPLLAGMRECEEETGFAGDGQAVFLGKNQPNPAFMNNLCFTYLWTNCTRKASQMLDGNEDIEVVEIPLIHIPHLIREGVLQHSLTLTAFFFLQLHDQSLLEGVREM